MSTNNTNTTNFIPMTYNALRRTFDGHNSFVNCYAWPQNIAFFCLCVYVYAWYLFNDFAGSFSIILILIGIYWYWKRDYDAFSLRNPIILLFLAAVIVQLVSWYLATQSHPHMADSSPKVHRMGIWFKMIPIAIILGGRTDRVLLCGLLAIAALFSAPFITGGGMSEIQAGFSGKRIDLGINNAQHAAMISGVLLLSLLAALVTHISLPLSKRFWLYSMLIFALFIVAAIVIFTQTRGVWLGLAAALPILLIHVIVCGKGNLRRATNKIFAGLFLLAIILIPFQGVFEKRIGSVDRSFGSLSSPYKALMKTGSMRLRTESWIESWQWIQKRPLLGWGGNIEKHIISSSKMTDSNGNSIQFGHLHNSYMEILANYGIAGLILLIMLCSYLMRCAYKSWRSKVMPTPIYLFLISFLPFWLIVNMFESYFFYSSGEYIVAIVGGIILSYYWRTITKKTPTTANLS